MNPPDPARQTAAQLRDRAADLLEHHFPKGVCKDRGHALVLLAELTILYEDALTASAQEQEAQAIVRRARIESLKDERDALQTALTTARKSLKTIRDAYTARVKHTWRCNFCETMDGHSPSCVHSVAVAGLAALPPEGR